MGSMGSGVLSSGSPKGWTMRQRSAACARAADETLHSHVFGSAAHALDLQTVSLAHLDRPPLAQLLLQSGGQDAVGGLRHALDRAEQVGQLLVQIGGLAVHAGELRREPCPHRVHRAGTAAFGGVGGAQVRERVGELARHLVHVCQCQQAFREECVELVAFGAHRGVAQHVACHRDAARGQVHPRRQSKAQPARRGSARCAHRAFQHRGADVARVEQAVRVHQREHQLQREPALCLTAVR